MDKLLFFGIGYLLGKSGTGYNGPIVKIDDKGINVFGFPLVINEKSKNSSYIFWNKS
jgi:hypothetical protein